MTVVTISTDDLSQMISGILEEKLKPIREKLLYEPDVTILSDEDAARLKRVSVSTIRRMKADGRVGSILTPKGRMCRVCDVEDK